MKRPRKQLLLKLGVFLLLGAIVNVAVAWGSATVIGFADTTDSVVAFRTSSAGTWNVETYKRFSAFRLSSVRVREPRPEYSEGESPAVLTPCWVDLPVEIDQQRRGELWYVEARGWPLLTLWSITNGIGKSLDGLTARLPAKHAINLPLSQFSGEMGFIPRVLPLKPIWPGFAINSIFYAAMLWLLWIASGKIRRFIRVKRHRCPACGYEIAEGVGPRCSECGTLLPWMKESPT